MGNNWALFPRPQQQPPTAEFGVSLGKSGRCCSEREREEGVEITEEDEECPESNCFVGREGLKQQQWGSWEMSTHTHERLNKIREAAVGS